MSSTTASVLQIGLENGVEYYGDIADPAQFATMPCPTTPNTPRNFFGVTLIADIVSVNNDPAKGNYVGRTRVILASPILAPGKAIADITRTALREHVFEIMDSAGREIGSIMSTGFSGGPLPPGIGSPAGQRANWAIVGGTGAYLGARGQVAGTGAGFRAASMAEDPSQRRMPSCPGVSTNLILYVIPMHRPRIMMTPAGPLVLHDNHELVTVLTPAHAHQDLVLFATGLGPTNPDVDLNQPFPLAAPLVNSPVSVKVNGIPAAVAIARGVPGTVNAYEVRFKMPNGVGTGSVPVQVTAAWIAGPAVSIWAA